VVDYKLVECLWIASTMYAELLKVHLLLVDILMDNIVDVLPTKFQGLVAMSH
jgi:hypothetical protein